MGRTLATLVLLASAFAFATPASAATPECFCRYEGTCVGLPNVDESQCLSTTSSPCLALSVAATTEWTEDADGLMGEPLAAACDALAKAYSDDSAATSATVTPTVGYAIPQLNVKIPGVDFTVPTEKSGVATSNFIGTYVTGVYRYLIGFAMTVAIVMMMVGGLQYVMGASSGDVKSGKKRITDAVEGLVLLMFVAVILFTVNPELILFRPLSIGNIAKVAWEEQAKENLAQCGEMKGEIPPCSVTTLKQPFGWTQELTDAVNAAATLKGVDANLIAMHIQKESGGNINFGKKVGPCGEVGPSQFMPATAESITDADCCISIVRGPKKKVSDGEKSTCGKSLDSAVWPPSKADFPTRCEAMCGNCQVASAACADKFGTKENIDFIIAATAELVKRNLEAAGGDFALEACAYNGSGTAAAKYAEDAIDVYKKICISSGGSN